MLCFWNKKLADQLNCEQFFVMLTYKNVLFGVGRSPDSEYHAIAELSTMDLMMADLKALEAYANYYYYRVKVLSKPLPDVYDPDEVAEYFSFRPQVVALRLLEVPWMLLV